MRMCMCVCWLQQYERMMKKFKQFANQIVGTLVGFKKFAQLEFHLKLIAQLCHIDKNALKMIFITYNAQENFTKNP